ncbi:tetratricopeptide repeat-containing sensor histidine kinase [Mucilaginibacter celer]|uniref:histidine kinase n=1 Tax=Mucilaginibacter celer TaxID=2305508 RepID=A0A494VK60_9SPHI|nr:sensor histidine kinase [Mucilaginibacter celer]AYL94309.1 sensor histidine kinase [Mucilaginibacter celer]
MQWVDNRLLSGLTGYSLCRIGLSGLFLLASLFARAQYRGTPAALNAARIQLCSGLLTVAKDAGVDLDSTLVLASHASRISRVPVIMEDMTGDYAAESLTWMDKGQQKVFEQRIAGEKGEAHAKDMLALGAYLAFSPGLSTVRNDQAINVLNQALRELAACKLSRLYAQGLILKGKCLIKKVDTLAGVPCFDIIKSDPRFRNDKRLMAKALTYEGTYYPYLPSTSPLRIKFLQAAVKIYQELKDEISQVNVLQNIAYLSFAAGKPDRTLAAVQQTLAIQHEIKFPYTHYSTDLLCFLAFIRGDYPRALSIAVESVRTAEMTKDSIGLAYFYLRVSDAYWAADGHSAESNLWANKALRGFMKYGGDASLYRVLGNMDLVHYSYGSSKKLLRLLNGMMKSYPPRNTIQRQDLYSVFGSCYEEIGDFRNAEKYYLSAVALADSNDFSTANRFRGYVYISIGNFYIHRKNYSRARSYFISYLTGKPGRGAEWAYRLDAYHSLFRIDSAQGKFDAMKNLYQFFRLRDSIYTGQKNKAFEELNVRYHTLQKQKDLDMYRSKSLLQQQEARASRRNMYIGFAALLIVILFILARFISKQKSNRLLSLQKEEIDKKNHLLETIVREKDELLVSKEWLLKEVHHRVKNNLQLVMSLLNSQTNYLKDEAAMKAVLESRHRVLAMSLIHQTLYSSENVSSIEMGNYIRTVVEQLQESYETRGHIYIELQIEQLRLDVSLAVPVGLILNELVTNAIKHAFELRDANRIVVSFFKSAEEEITLIVADNGKGIPGDLDTSTTGSFGITLINGLTEDLNGNFSLENLAGTTATLVFRYEDVFSRASLSEL